MLYYVSFLLKIRVSREFAGVSKEACSAAQDSSRSVENDQKRSWPAKRWQYEGGSGKCTMVVLYFSIYIACLGHNYYVVLNEDC